MNNMTHQPKREWEIVIEQQLEKSEDVFYSDNGYDSLSKWLKSEENILMKNDPYPESHVEISSVKMIALIKQVEDEAIRRTVMKVRTEIETCQNPYTTLMASNRIFMLAREKFLDLPSLTITKEEVLKDIEEVK